MEAHRKGELTEAVVVTELKRRGIPVSIPFGDNERYDLVAESSGILHRLQVKTGRISDGCIHFHGKSSHTNSTGNVYKTYDGDVDFFTVYCHQREELYLIGEQEFESDMCLRIADPEIEQPSINWAEGYEFDERWPPENAENPPTRPVEQTIESLRNRGVDVFDARNSEATYDFILRSPGDELFRVVVLEGSVTNGRVRFGTGRSALPSAKEIDYVLVNCEEVEEQYLLDRSDFDRTMSLRVQEPAQMQPSINWAENYEFDEQWPPA